jgi:hypothetical protein
MFRTNGNGHNGNGSSHSRIWPRLFGWKRRPVVSQAPFRRLALQLHYDLASPDQPRSVLLTSPADADAAAPSSILISMCLAQEIRKPVLLVDATSSPSAADRLMKTAGGPGFSDLLMNPALRVADLAVASIHTNLSFLPAGSSPIAAVDPPSLSRVLSQAAADYDFVLFAGGSVLNDSMTRALAPHVGCVLLLGIENRTMVDELDAAQSALVLGKARRIALVLATREGSR